MKKWLILTGISMLLTGCGIHKHFTTPTFAERDLVGGKWYCESSYGTWSSLTKEYYEYFPDGTILNYGSITVLQDGQQFKYSFKNKGTWQLNGWYLHEQLTDSSIKRDFSATVKKALGASPKLKAFENEVFNRLMIVIEMAKRVGASREIEVITPNMLTTIYNTSYVICAR